MNTVRKGDLGGGVQCGGFWSDGGKNLMVSGLCHRIHSCVLNRVDEERYIACFDNISITTLFAYRTRFVI